MPMCRPPHLSSSAHNVRKDPCARFPVVQQELEFIIRQILNPQALLDQIPFDEISQTPIIRRTAQMLAELMGKPLGRTRCV